MTTTIKLGRGLDLPIEAVTQTFALLAKRGAGKTYAALKLAEGMLDAHAQVVAIDPVGKWWSLRLAADGKAPGFEIPVFGGHHGDLPLEPGAGKLMADLVVDRGISLVLDVSIMRKGDRKHFVTDFAEQLLLRKKRERAPTAMHLFLEESQVFVPQRTQRGEERMLGAFEDLVKLGRNYGVGATLISQRPQAVNKDVLTQAECLLVLQTIGAQERKALREWMKEVGVDRSEAIDELPSLEVGEAYLWSPGWLREFRRVRIGKRKTFDASATPKVGAKAGTAAPRKLADHELEALRQTMAEVVEKAEQDDPKALRRKVAELRAQVKKLETRPPAADDQAVETARAEGLEQGRTVATRAVAQWEARASVIAEALERAGMALDPVLDALRTAAAAARKPLDVDLDALPAMARTNRGTPRSVPRDAIVSSGIARARAASAGDTPGITGGCRRMLEVLASRSPAGFTIAQWATLAGLKRTGGTWSTYLSRLRTAGFVAREGDLWRATYEGIAEIGDVPPAPTTPDEVLEMWKARLGGGAARMLDAIVAEPDGITREKLAEAVRITRSGGTFGTYLSRIRSNGLIEEDGDTIRPSSVLR